MITPYNIQTLLWLKRQRIRSLIYYESQLTTILHILVTNVLWYEYEYEYEYEIRILKSKSRFPNRTQPEIYVFGFFFFTVRLRNPKKGLKNCP